MNSRYLLVPLILCTILLGGIIFFDQSSRDAATGLLASSPTAPAAGASQQVSGFLLNAAHRAAIFLSALNSDVFFYAALAVIGTFMTLLVIRSGKSSPQEEFKIEALLKDLTDEKDKAQNLAKLKSEFLNQVSHELRTPLAVIMGYVDCMIDGLYGQVDTKHKDILKVVAKQSVDLKEMIDRILVFSRLEADKTRLRVEAFPLSMIADDLMQTYDFIGKQKGIEIKWDLPAQDLTLKSDPERIKEILNNLMQNAVKFTSHGSVTLRIGYLAAMDSILLEVSDTGTGIAKEHLTSIFEPFMQVNKTSTVNSRGGIGLGLSIVKKHVEQLDGLVDVKSEVGQGTTFRIVIPRVYQERAERSKKPSRLTRLLPGKRSSKAKVQQLGAAALKTSHDSIANLTSH